MRPPFQVRRQRVGNPLQRRVAEAKHLGIQRRRRLPELGPASEAARDGGLEAHVVLPRVVDAGHLGGGRLRVLRERRSRRGRIASAFDDGLERRAGRVELLRQALARVEVPANVTAEGRQGLEDLRGQGSLRPQLDQVRQRLQHARHDPLVELIPHATLMQQPLQSTVLHHIGVLVVGEFVRQHRPVLLAVVAAERRSRDICQAIGADGQRLTLRDVLLGLAVEVLVVLRLPAVLDDGLESLLVAKLLHLRLVGLVRLGVALVELEVVPLPPPPLLDLEAARILIQILFGAVDRFELLSLQGW
mmetsp:Transcript_27187/g.84594  ORF Transcript_27187/g.84594 Transcript_27187/m.84594 type:complete len:303 (-) Transcript_27187:479-1387(-)